MSRSPHADYRTDLPRLQGRNGPARALCVLTGLVGFASYLGTASSLWAEPAASGSSTASPRPAEAAAGKRPNKERATKSALPATADRESRIALKPVGGRTGSAVSTSLSVGRPTETDPVAASIAQAKRMIADCKARYLKVNDYSCDFYKRERIDGKLTDLHVMSMKERTQPKSIYFKFQQPNRGREAIFVEGRNNGRILAHDIGFTKLLAGTMALDPTGSRAMENNRHPITEAGIGELIETVEERWSKELSTAHSVITHAKDLQIGPHTSVVMIESLHPQRQPDFLFHKVRLYINQEHGLPIRFEAYDWPKHPDASPELLEEYTYLNLKLNVGFSDLDFDPANEQYSFGRF